MNTTRLEAFSDGVLAIIITIMVLELHVPNDATPHALLALLPVFFSYILSFVYVGIYWSNHHHMLHVVDRINGATLWANLHLLFWLSLVPFVTGWMGENHFTQLPVLVYGVVMMMAGVAYYILARVLIAYQGAGGTLASAVGADRKGVVSVVLYMVAIGLSFVNPWLSVALYITVALIWIRPDRRIEHVLGA